MMNSFSYIWGGYVAILLMYMFPTSGPPIATIVGITAGGLFNYFLNKRWSNR